MKFVFLHIPKTGGQSVHAFLADFWDEQQICPARENHQLRQIPIGRLRSYELFSGHLDWSLLDAVRGERFVFTVLRRPSDRILSFYFFMRRKAAGLPPETLTRPEHRGLWAALNVPPDEYFCEGKRGLREFLDNNYDNFYTYFFAGRTFDARQKLVRITKRYDTNFSLTDILEMAIENLSTLDRVYTVESLQALQDEITALIGRNSVNNRHLASFRLNAGAGDYESRLEELKTLGATGRTFERLGEMTRLDDELWQHVVQQPPCHPHGALESASNLLMT